MVDAVITGSSGFIGRALCQKLVEQGKTIFSLSHCDGDVASSTTWVDIPPAKVLVHLAARSYVPDSWKMSADFLSTNVVGTEHALKYCRQHGALMVYISAYLYGIPDCIPIHESHPVRPNNPYALSKHLSEQLCRFHGDVARLPVAILRLFNVFGPYQRDDFLIPSIHRQLIRGGEITVRDTSPRRDYVYIDDVVEAIILAMERHQHGVAPINIASGVSLGVDEIISTFQRVSGTNLPVIDLNERRVNEIPDVVADISEAWNRLGWRPSFSFQAGVQELVRLQQGCA